MKEEGRILRPSCEVQQFEELSVSETNGKTFTKHSRLLADQILKFRLGMKRTVRSVTELHRGTSPRGRGSQPWESIDKPILKPRDKRAQENRSATGTICTEYSHSIFLLLDYAAIA